MSPQNPFRIVVVLAALFITLAAPWAQARIKLITLPVRQRVEVQLDHPNVTLVEEERIVPLVRGVNQVDFSWANTSIDPNTILFRVLKPMGEGARQMEVKVLSVSYPPNENALVWQVSSSASGSARVRISYLLGNLTKSFHYRAVAANDEKTLELRQYIRVKNLANEEYGSAGIWAGYGKDFLKPIGLNETKEMLMHRYPQVHVKKTYTCNPAEFDYLDKPKDKLNVPMHYVLKNDKQNNLGASPLEFGKVRIFQDDGKGTTAFLGEDWGRYTPIDDEMKLYLGLAQDVSVKRTIDKNERHRIKGQLYRQEIVIKYEIENFKEQPITLDVAESIPYIRNELLGRRSRPVEWSIGEMTTFKGGLDTEESEFDKAVFHAKLPARDKDGKAEKIIHKFHLFIENEW